MSGRKALLSLFTFFFLAGVNATPAFAVSLTDFPSCVNPQGSVIAHYDHGDHAIIGNPKIQTGSDTVYQVSNNMVVQCFCPENGGTGVQTNWYKTSALSESEISVMKKEGWNYYNGEGWGLGNTGYLAKNVEYACKGTPSCTPTPTVTITPSPTVVTTTPTKPVLGLATTGNIVFIYSLITVGTFTLISGLLLRFLSRNK